MTLTQSKFSLIARRGVVVRLLLWVAMVVVLSCAFYALTWILGAPQPIVGPGSGTSLFGLIAFFSALMVMSRSDRGVQPYGLAIGDHWTRNLLLGLSIGAATLIIISILAIATGAWGLHIAEAGRWFSSFGKAFGGFPMAVTATITFAGFVAGTARERWGPTAAALLAATMYAGVSLMHPLGPTDGDSLALAASRFALMVVVVQLRFLSGDVVLGAAFLCGALFMERFIRKVALFSYESSSELAQALLAPAQHPIQSPGLWIELAILSIVVGVMLRTRPTREHSKPRVVSMKFARSYPFATMGALAPLDVWLPQLWRARFQIGAVYIPRLIATLILSAGNTILTLPERLAARLAPQRPLRQPPIFILGAHRSGTTHLHNLLSIDPQFTAPTTWQVMNPFGFRFSGWLLRPVFEIFSPWKRPMDAVAFGMGTPAEDEFAIANMTGLSPDWSLRLPRLARRYDRFGFPDQMTDKERAHWSKLHLRFIRSAFRYIDERPLLKNPHNTGRMELLLDLYPGAKFVHIRRDPVDVIRSNDHLAQTAHLLFQLQDPRDNERYIDRYPELYRAMEERFYEAADQLPSDRVIDVRYEDLAAHPGDTLKRIYEQLELPWTNEYESRLNAYLDRISDFKRNPKTPLTAEESAKLDAALGSLIERWRTMDENGASLHVERASDVQSSHA